MGSAQNKLSALTVDGQKQILILCVLWRRLGPRMVFIASLPHEASHSPCEPEIEWINKESK